MFIIFQDFSKSSVCISINLPQLCPRPPSSYLLSPKPTPPLSLSFFRLASPHYCLFFLTSLSLSAGSFLAAYKHALVIPFFKSSPLPPPLYHPISLLPFTSALLERLVWAQCLPFTSHSVFSPLLSSFWPVNTTTLGLDHTSSSLTKCPAATPSCPQIHPLSTRGQRSLVECKPIHVCLFKALECLPISLQIKITLPWETGPYAVWPLPDSSPVHLPPCQQGCWHSCNFYSSSPSVCGCLVA